ncbi:MAG TPA: hypothetical protein PKA90_07035 [Ignavibacteria bacterium]|nr:hypothetical protein [Ignavibacteria bacterium]HMR40170.1 hypothetical protein [Ignavibacteria bacterium]
MIIGKAYKIYLFSEKEYTGVLISQNEKEITIKSGNKSITIEMDNIFEISTDISPSDYKFLATLNIGTLAGNPNQGNSSNFLLNGRFSYFYADKRNIGGDLSVIFLKKANYNGYTGIETYQYQTYVDLLANAQIGTFNVRNTIEVYLNLGFGIHSQFINPFTSTYYSYNDSGYIYSSTPSSFTVYPLFQVGGGFIVKPSKNIGINFEMDLKFYSFDYVIIPTEGYVPFKLGVSYFFF